MEGILDKAFFWKWINFFLSIFLLIFGVLIYLIKRTDTLLIFIWLTELNLDIYSNFLRYKFNNIEILNYNFVVYSLPGGLWMMSFVLFFNTVWKIEDSQKYKWMFFAAIPAMSSEIFQYFEIIAGTFDIYDLIAYFSGYFIVVIYVMASEYILR